jgi:hypothetical protein
MDPMDGLLPHDITHDKFEEQLDLYPSHVRDVYQDAEDQRFIHIPKQVNRRKRPLLEKKEVEDLERWVRYV